MKRQSKKILAMLLSAMMLAAAASSCGQEKEPGSAPASSSSAASQTEETDSGLTPVGELPISKDGLTLTAFAQNNGSNNDWSYGNNDFTTWLVDQNGIQLDITLAASADAKEKLSLLITAGEYPEVLFRSGLSLSEQQIYGAQGMLLPLNDLIEKYAPTPRPCLKPILWRKPRSPWGTAICTTCPPSTSATIAARPRKCGSTRPGSSSWAWKRPRPPRNSTNI